MSSSAAAVLVAHIQRFVPEVMRQRNTPGMSLAVALDGEPIWSGAFGLADVGRATPMTADSVARVGSITKMYVAVAVMQLVDAGLVDIHAPVSDHLPELPLDNPLGERPVTPFDLMTFRSGMNGDIGDAMLSPPPPLAEHLTAALARDSVPEYGRSWRRWSAKVGEKCQYSNLGIAVLGRLVEVANPDGLSLQAYVDEHIARPLGMGSTCLPPAPIAPHVSADVLARLMTGYAGFATVNLRSPDVYNADHPATGLLTSATDHLRLLLAMQHGGRHADHRLLSPESVEQMTTPHVPFQETAALGWCAGLGTIVNRTGGSDAWFGHPGGQPWGWCSDSRVYPGLGLTVVACANRFDMPRWHESANPRITDLVFDSLVDLLTAHRRVAPADERPWAWKESYLMGVLTFERLKYLGVVDPDVHRVVGQMTDGAVVDSAWHADAFVAGALDARAAGDTVSSVRRFLAESAQLTRADLSLAWRGIGGDRPAMPLDFWDPATLHDDVPAG